MIGVIEGNIVGILISVLIFIVSGVPLHLAIKLFGGDTTILKTALVIFISGIIVNFVRTFAGLIGGILSFIVMIWIYKVSFDLGWIRAFLAWITQFLIIALIALVIFFVIGIGTMSAFFVL